MKVAGKLVNQVYDKISLCVTVFDLSAIYLSIFGIISINTNNHIQEHPQSMEKCDAVFLTSSSLALSANIFLKNITRS